MSTSLRAHSTVLNLVRKANPREDLRRQKVFAWAVVALIIIGNVNLTRWALVIRGETQAASRWRRLWRFLNNHRVNIGDYYRPFITTILRNWAGEDVLVAIDTTSPKGICVVCRVALVYRGRSIPLSWKTFPTQGHTLAFDSYRPLLEDARALLKDCRSVTLLGDRGFGDVKLMRWCLDSDWHFALRLKKSRRVQFSTGQSFKLSRFAIKATQVRVLRDVHLSGFAVPRLGPVQIHLALSPEAGSDAWFIASDRRDGFAVLAAYRCRMNIEHAFRDDKSGGFDWESSHLVAPEQVDRLLLILAVATLFIVSEGVFVVESGQRKSVDAHTRRGLSYFQIGCRAIQRALALGKKLKLRLLMNPGPDPDPLSLHGLPFKISGRFTWLPGDPLPAGI